MSLFNSLLRHLSDGKPHLLSDLASQLHIDEQSLSAMLAECQSDGLDLQWDECVRWHDPTEPLSRSKIRHAMTSRFNGEVSVAYKVGSTNQQLRDDFQHQKIWLAEMQSSGRGRRGRRWFSPPAANIYLSLGWRFNSTVTELSGLSLAVGMKLIEALQPYAKGKLAVKWPNDIYLDERKLAGILIESVPRGESQTEMIIGIGVNVSMQSADQLDQPWTYLGRNQDRLDRSLLVAAILDALFNFLADDTMLAGELIDTYIQHHWADYDVLEGRSVSVIDGEQELLGVAAGIDEHYNFLLRTPDGLRAFCSADVSLRLARETSE
ncbi:MAG TPA: biotin--[acetyl-CoA-carboxylase] ligase [Gammaproteobacteria bacterium]|nr:biotin--[acetyl-CoA-carboxylase] ligase [Gammaproteobacteria bacterium]